MLPTPITTHLSRPEYRDVYDPAEDTFLLLDALEEQTSYLKHNVVPTICLEIGSGSGCVITFLATLLGPLSCLYLATDINSVAARATLETSRVNSVYLDVINTEFAYSLDSRLSKSIDVLIFNPPYVVTSDEEVGSTSIEAAWAGGLDGRKVIDAFLELLPTLLSPRGVCYMVCIRENKPDEIGELVKRYGLESQNIMTRTAGRERLSILKFTYSQHAVP
ncbi:hypothetical protein SmJEL517_g01077 [Synchytrium microbalum]|uniref:Uncharacterized protein n=1 Tax=Synchytrium microbalum TaxID=1806994 RepID=A0A507CC39_9FUNG|nr:uncharacterized protein SmJEL517_g01077 [Synchytrium microbalum]TPX37182.1 hypothetical protein SmJEL517_g01077 [Synchytrium microbalum]